MKMVRKIGGGGFKVDKLLLEGSWRHRQRQPRTMRLRTWRLEELPCNVGTLA